MLYAPILTPLRARCLLGLFSRVTAIGKPPGMTPTFASVFQTLSRESRSPLIEPARPMWVRRAESWWALCTVVDLV